jgi:hypothetical protein
MAIRNEPAGDLTEDCDGCARETPHSVSIQLRTESTKEENAEFSREPYRVSECMHCGEQRILRMNNA